MRWLITGAAGFIGSHLVEELLRRGQAVVGLDNFATGRRTNLEDVLFRLPAEAARRLECIDADIRDLDACRRAVTGARYVLHQAALGSVPRSIEDPITTNAVNVDGFVNMLVAAREAGVGRFLYASSSAVYGDSKASPKREGSEGRPLSPYAASKRANEDYATAFANAYGMSIVGLRYFNVYGPRQDPNGPYAAVVPRWIGRLLGEEPCEIFGDGSTSRDFTYVADVVAANLAAAQSAQVTGVYNVAYGTGTTLNELYAVLRQQVAVLKGSATIGDLEPIYRLFRAGDIRQSLADNSRARAAFGFAPAYAPDRGLAETTAWFAAHPPQRATKPNSGASGS